MNNQEWKKVYGKATTNKKMYEKLMKELCFELEKDHNWAANRVVKGKCLTTNCANFYSKSFNNLVRFGGPFCSICISGDLLVNKYPEIASSIIKSTYNIDEVTCGTQKKVIFQCDKSCYRCNQKHEWECSIQSRVSGSGCPQCIGHQICPCQGEDEFRCFKCQTIKNNSEKVGSKNICKMCKNTYYDDNLQKFIGHMYLSIKRRGVVNSKKLGNMTYEYLLELCEKQKLKCAISHTPMSIGHHHDWKISPERIDNNKGYDMDNVVLIVCELQSSFCQWTCDKWDIICSLVEGTQTEPIPIETDVLNKYIESAKITRHPVKTSKNVPDDKDGNKYCIDCCQYILKTFFAKNRKICKSCLAIRENKYSRTLRGKLMSLIHSSKDKRKFKKGDSAKHSITFEYLLNLYYKQSGRCAYSMIPLDTAGIFMMSLERINTLQGYIEGNVCLIIVGLNTGDCSVRKHVEDKRTGSGGWNRNKLLYAVSCNQRKIVPKISYIKDVSFT